MIKNKHRECDKCKMQAELQIKLELQKTKWGDLVIEENVCYRC